MKKYQAFHWSRNDDCLGYGDGRQIVLGETLSVQGTPKLCDFGLHGSQSIVDALGYASGSHLWVVEIWGKVDVGDDKLCGLHRTAIIEYGDMLLLIVEFASWCADRARQHAEYAAKYTAKYAAESAKYAAESAEYAAEYAAKSAEYAAKSAEYAAKYAAKSAEYAAEYTAEYAAESAESEKQLQEQWWQEKLSQLR